MMYSIRGKLNYKNGEYCIIECSNGIGYKCLITERTYMGLPEIGEECFLYTEMSIKDEFILLYGFKDEEELKCYKYLIKANGIGGKLALSILSKYTPAEIYGLIQAGDEKTLSKVQGLGLSKATNMIVYLKPLIIKEMGAMPEPEIEVKKSKKSNKNKKEAIEILMSVGLSKEDAADRVNEVDYTLSTEEIVKEVLKNI